MSAKDVPSTYTHRGVTYHQTWWHSAPGYGAQAWCHACDWRQDFGDYNGAYNGWLGLGAVETACWRHEEATRGDAPESTDGTTEVGITRA